MIKSKSIKRWPNLTITTQAESLVRKREEGRRPAMTKKGGAGELIRKEIEHTRAGHPQNKVHFSIKSMLLFKV